MVILRFRQLTLHLFRFTQSLMTYSHLLLEKVTLRYRSCFWLVSSVSCEMELGGPVVVKLVQFREKWSDAVSFHQDDPTNTHQTLTLHYTSNSERFCQRETLRLLMLLWEFLFTWLMAFFWIVPQMFPDNWLHECRKDFPVQTNR